MTFYSKLAKKDKIHNINKMNVVNVIAAKIKKSRDVLVSRFGGNRVSASAPERFADGYGQEVWEMDEPPRPRVYTRPTDTLTHDTPGAYGPSFPRGRRQRNPYTGEQQTTQTIFLEDRLWQSMHLPQVAGEEKHDFSGGPITYNPQLGSTPV